MASIEKRAAKNRARKAAKRAQRAEPHRQQVAERKTATANAELMRAPYVARDPLNPEHVRRSTRSHAGYAATNGVGLSGRWYGEGSRGMAYAVNTTPVADWHRTHGGALDTAEGTVRQVEAARLAPRASTLRTDGMQATIERARAEQDTLTPKHEARRAEEIARAEHEARINAERR